MSDKKESTENVKSEPQQGEKEHGANLKDLEPNQIITGDPRVGGLKCGMIIWLWCKMCLMLLITFTWTSYMDNGILSIWEFRRFWGSKFVPVKQTAVGRYLLWELPESVETSLFGERYIVDLNRLDRSEYRELKQKETLVVFLDDHKIPSQYEAFQAAALNNHKRPMSNPVTFAVGDLTWKSGEYLKNVEGTLTVQHGNERGVVFKGDFTSDNIHAFVYDLMNPLVTKVNGLGDPLIKASIEERGFVVVAMINTKNDDRITMLNSLAEHYRTNDKIKFLMHQASGWQNTLACYFTFEPRYEIYDGGEWTFEKFDPFYRARILPPTINLNASNYDDVMSNGRSMLWIITEESLDHSSYKELLHAHKADFILCFVNYSTVKSFVNGVGITSAPNYLVTKGEKTGFLFPKDELFGNMFRLSKWLKKIQRGGVKSVEVDARKSEVFRVSVASGTESNRDIEM